LRVEWAEGRARVERWDEEINLRLEEMVRSIKALVYKSDTWKSRIHSRTDQSLSIRRGLDAFASRQSAIYEGLARSFYSLWKPTVEQLDLHVNWPLSIIAVPTNHKIDGLIDGSTLANISNYRADILDDDSQVSNDDEQNNESLDGAFHSSKSTRLTTSLDDDNEDDDLDSSKGTYLHEYLSDDDNSLF
jgi:hypothetical protein